MIGRAANYPAIGEGNLEECIKHLFSAAVHLLSSDVPWDWPVTFRSSSDFGPPCDFMLLPGDKINRPGLWTD